CCRLEVCSFCHPSSAAEGVPALEEEAPNLLPLDVMMPEVDGWDMPRQVQDRFGVGAIPVLVFSGTVDERAVSDAAARGARGFVGKPFDLQQLIDQAKQIAPV